MKLTKLLLFICLYCVCFRVTTTVAQHVTPNRCQRQYRLTAMWQPLFTLTAQNTAYCSVTQTIGCFMMGSFFKRYTC